MFTIINVSLDDIFKRYHVENTEGMLRLEEDDLIDSIKDAGEIPVYEITKKSRKSMESLEAQGPRYKLVPHLSIKRLVESNTVKMFMPIDFWRKEHKVKAKDLDIFRRMDMATTGDETLSLMIEMKVGINLRPGEQADVNWTNEFVEDVVLRHPMMSKCKVMKDGKEYQRILPEILKKKTTTVNFDNLDYRTVQQMAKKEGIEFIGISKNDLVAKLQEIAIKKAAA